MVVPPISSAVEVTTVVSSTGIIDCSISPLKQQPRHHPHKTKAVYTPDLTLRQGTPLSIQGIEYARAHPFSPLLSSTKYQTLMNLLNITEYAGERDNQTNLPHGSGKAITIQGDQLSGSWDQGILIGTVSIIYHDGISYTGSIDPRGVLCGEGRMYWQDGSVYEGAFDNNKRHGVGVFRDPSFNMVYNGEWVDGLRQGRGKQSYSSSSYYVGEWKAGKRDGHGVMRYPSGNIYEGQWACDHKHGSGCMTWSSVHHRYEGEWVNDEMHGEGTYVYFGSTLSSQHPIHNTYRGTFSRNERHGRGSFFYADGSEYHGEYSHQGKHGAGLFVFPNGSMIRGEWTNDQLTQNLIEYERQSIGAIVLHVDDICDDKNDVEAVTTLIHRHYKEIRGLYRLFSHWIDNDTAADADPGVCTETHTNTNNQIREGYGVRLNGAQLEMCVKQLGILCKSISLATINRILLHRLVFDPSYPGQILFPITSLHDPHKVILFRDFIAFLARLAHHLYHAENGILSRGVNKLITESILPFYQNTMSKTIQDNILTIREENETLDKHSSMIEIRQKYKDRINRLFQALATHRTKASTSAGSSMKSSGNQVLSDSTVEFEALVSYLNRYQVIDECFTFQHLIHWTTSTYPSTLVLESREWSSHEFLTLIIQLGIYVCWVKLEHERRREGREIQRLEKTTARLEYLHQIRQREWERIKECEQAALAQLAEEQEMLDDQTKKKNKASKSGSVVNTSRRPASGSSSQQQHPTKNPRGINKPHHKHRNKKTEGHFGVDEINETGAAEEEVIDEIVVCMDSIVSLVEDIISDQEVVLPLNISEKRWRELPFDEETVSRLCIDVNALLATIT